MYLHVGKNVVVPHGDIVAIFDLDNSSQSIQTRDFLSRAEKAGEVINVAEDLPKSFVLCAPPEGGQRVYLSQLMSATLLKRVENFVFE